MIINPREEQWLRRKYPDAPLEFYEFATTLHSRRDGKLTAFQHDDGDLRLQYGFPDGLFTFYEIYVAQDQLCPICEKILSLVRTDMHVDHEHTSKLILGIVHAGCNSHRRHDWGRTRGKRSIYWISMKAYELAPPALKVGRFYFNDVRRCTRSSTTMEKHKKREQKIRRDKEAYLDRVKIWSQFLDMDLSDV